eukprot:CAMPEP_0197467946 /NCGR_PEP_ID=MMETSP1175-20131217/65825_1 /TAXON_ID=1003142 /ORGANISM="Triceratium dubium, Strain CCMP147" /LENGTH=182 /DNA_ID=CAMNT_0043004037 /DNA_START=187 /DNA_END=732 /DNA_ORIENTATION=-
MSSYPGAPATQTAGGVVSTTKTYYPGTSATQTTTVIPPPNASAIKPADVEAPFPVEYSSTNDRDEDGMGMGIAMVILTIIAFIFAFLPVPFVSFVCMIATIVISSIVVCGCCAAGSYNLKPRTKKFALATLICCSLIFILQIIYLIAAATAVANEATTTGTISARTAQGVTVGAFVMLVLVW